MVHEVDAVTGLMDVARGECVAFSGYRPEKMERSFRRGGDESSVCAAIRDEVIFRYENGARMFLSGMAEGFDLWAAREVVRLVREGVCPAAGLVAVVPYRGQAAGYSPVFGKLYEEMLEAASRVAVLSERYYKDCFLRRNDWLVDNAAVLICYYDGLPGGTRYTVRRAVRERLSVVNLCDRELPLFRRY